jgi:hypothetical protein
MTPVMNLDLDLDRYQNGKLDPDSDWHQNDADPHLMHTMNPNSPFQEKLQYCLT